ncbi:MAG: hypothetical protein NXI20_00765 [bacterium]|nr:hypothetical protein [bacterium]
MFWNKKPKSIITTEDEEWLISVFDWFEDKFKLKIEDMEMYPPTTNFIGFKYQGTTDDVINMVELVREKMMVRKSSRIEVYFYDEFQRMEFTDEAIISNYEEGTQLSNGQYSKDLLGIYQIGIERSLIKNPILLIATIAHEIAHIKLLGERKIKENDEPLTDVITSLFGFGIFTANSSISKMTTYSGNTHSGWNMSGGSGYLHYKIHAFMLALWLFKKGQDDADWLQYLERDILSGVKKSLKYLKAISD